MYTFIHLHTHTHTHIHIHIYIYNTYTYTIHIHIHFHFYIHIHIHLHIHKHIHIIYITYIYIQTYKHTYMNLRTASGFLLLAPFYLLRIWFFMLYSTRYLRRGTRKVGTHEILFQPFVTNSITCSCSRCACVLKLMPAMERGFGSCFMSFFGGKSVRVCVKC